jgi:hypothetical protein
MDIELINRLIRFHKAGLLQYRHYIDPAAQYLEEQTIKALEELKGTNKHVEDVQDSQQDL